MWGTEWLECQTFLSVCFITRFVILLCHPEFCIQVKLYYQGSLTYTQTGRVPGPQGHPSLTPGGIVSCSQLRHCSFFRQLRHPHALSCISSVRPKPLDNQRNKKTFLWKSMETTLWDRSQSYVVRCSTWSHHTLLITNGLCVNSPTVHARYVCMRDYTSRQTSVPPTDLSALSQHSSGFVLLWVRFCKLSVLWPA